MLPNDPATPPVPPSRHPLGDNPREQLTSAPSYGAELSQWLLSATEQLSGQGIRPEALAELIPERRRWLLRRPATMHPMGQVWRLGVFLLSTEGSLLAAGPHTRSRERGRQGYQSLSLEERRDTAAAAFRGGFPAGDSVNYGAQLLSLEALDGLLTAGVEAELGPILISGGRCAVRWRAGASAAQSPGLRAYLRERLALLLEPPFAP